MILLSTFKTACPTNREPAEWVSVLNTILPKYGIIGHRREAMFLAQTGHESADYTRLIENLNYSADGLRKTFPRYFTASEAQAFARKPQEISNRVYGKRLGNIHPNDGWAFRGLGIIQLTGRANHTAFGKTLGLTAEQVRDYMQTKKGMVEAACWFWSTNGLNAPSDKLNIEAVTRIINGGTNGLADRSKRLRRLT